MLIISIIFYSIHTFSSTIVNVLNRRRGVSYYICSYRCTILLLISLSPSRLPQSHPFGAQSKTTYNTIQDDCLDDIVACRCIQSDGCARVPGLNFRIERICS